MFVSTCVIKWKAPIVIRLSTTSTAASLDLLKSVFRILDLIPSNYYILFYFFLTHLRFNAFIRHLFFSSTSICFYILFQMRNKRGKIYSFKLHKMSVSIIFPFFSLSTFSIFILLN